MVPHDQFIHVFFPLLFFMSGRLSCTFYSGLIISISHYKVVVLIAYSRLSHFQTAEIPKERTCMEEPKVNIIIVFSIMSSQWSVLHTHMLSFCLVGGLGRDGDGPTYPCLFFFFFLPLLSFML